MSQFMNFIHSNQFLLNFSPGPLPQRLIVGFVDAEAAIGNTNSNPFVFENFSMNYINCSTDQSQILLPFKPDFTNDNYAMNYASLFDNTHISVTNSGNNISYSEYKKSYALTVFELTNDSSSSENYWNVNKSGSLRLQIVFSRALTKPVSVIILAEFNSLIEVVF